LNPSNPIKQTPPFLFLLNGRNRKSDSYTHQNTHGRFPPIHSSIKMFSKLGPPKTKNGISVSFINHTFPFTHPCYIPMTFYSVKEKLEKSATGTESLGFIVKKDSASSFKI
jgi:hypothetical protein